MRGPEAQHLEGFRSLEDECTDPNLKVTGQIPDWLNGSLLRTGPAKFEVGTESMRHWFDGLAMLHRFTIAGGRVAYANRFLGSRSYRAARRSGRISYSEFATDPCRKLFRRVQSVFYSSRIPDNANINVGALGQRFMAMTETALPVEFDPDTLASAEVHPYRAPGQLSTAHPHVDRATGGLINYAAKLGPRSSYRFFSLDANGGRPRVLTKLPVSEPAYMHSFGMSSKWIVLAEFPFVVNPLRLALAGRPYIENYRWKPGLGTRITLFDRVTGRRRGPFRTEARFAFHHVNAFDTNGQLVVDLCSYPDPRLVEDLYLERLHQGKPIARPRLERLRIDTNKKTVSTQLLSDQPLELPRINYEQRNERPYRYVWGTDTGSSGWTEKIIKVDLETGEHRSWHLAGCFPGEAVFVSRPGAEGEDDGILLSIVFDASAGCSSLVVLNANDLHELARAQAPHRIPFHFHGQFFPESIPA